MKRQLLPLAALGLAVLVAACAGTSGPLGTLPPASGSPAPSLPQASPDQTPGAGSPAPSSPSTSTPPPTGPSVSPSPVGTTIVRAYFFLGGDVGTAGLVPVLREVPKTQAVARAALEQLLRGPAGRETMDGGGISTAVPEDTELLGVSISGGVATVDLSGEFASGGGSASSMIRLGQVTYTLTQFPTVQRVSFKVDGRPVTVFGSEGIVLDGPQAREDYRDLLPDIWVDRPAWGAALGNPGRVTGLANVFEAQFHVAILDGDGVPIADQPVMATCGTGCWGTFDVTLAYDVPEPQWGTLRSYNLSAKDGSVESVRDYPVWLTPEG
jgi:spore germination protein GerM